MATLQNTLYDKKFFFNYTFHFVSDVYHEKCNVDYTSFFVCIYVSHIFNKSSTAFISHT